MSNVKDVDGAVAAAWERVRTHDDMVNYVVVTATGKKKIKLKVAGSGGGGFDQVLGSARAHAAPSCHSKTLSAPEATHTTRPRARIRPQSAGGG